MARPLWLLAAACLCLWSRAGVQAAESSDYTGGYLHCLGSSNAKVGSTAALECVNAELALQEQQLDLAYRRLRYAYPEASQSKLDNAQALWLKYREAHCDADWEVDPRLDALPEAFCRLDDTVSRRKFLEGILKAWIVE